MNFYRIDYLMYEHLHTILLYATDPFQAIEVLKKSFPEAHLVYIMQELDGKSALKIKYTNWESYMRSLMEVQW